MAPIQRLEDSTMASLAGSIKGTPSFFAPEAAAGHVDQVDELSDVFLLGGTLLPHDAGRPPRTRQSRSSSEGCLRTPRPWRPPPPQPQSRPIARPLDAICRKALALKKEDRYSSAAALAEDVQRYLAGDPVLAYPEKPAGTHLALGQSGTGSKLQPSGGGPGDHLHRRVDRFSSW